MTAPLTGRKVFLFVASAFGLIIAVNLFMATQAVRTFPGLEVKNGYVASQSFDTDREAQLALGWTVSAGYADGLLRLQILGPDGAPVQPDSLTGTLGRATHTKDDMTPIFAWDGEAYTFPAELAPGNWNFRMVALAADGTPFRQRIPFYVKSGA
ncbi:FixH family protein [Pseudoruegeria sp. SHC-113]|uniref:FixH family protein n=1 Tax=Pseudoruegeria sp. SHC-113 TaxID=2855439 RepID=UPI0021BAD987|nr:FixH family protein [Pseudoruegeria sp. SHC-113]MCT8161777.1 FixH family protein [Pseudoruegeria sp. SHC-113]